MSNLSLISDEVYAYLVSVSKSYADLCSKLGYAKSGDMYGCLRSRTEELGLDISHFGLTRVYGEQLGRREVKKNLIQKYQNEKRPVVCEFCGIAEWKNKPITLHLDHIDGDRQNNTEENLRFLCPNCHSQTETYGSKKLKGSKTGTSRLFKILSQYSKSEIQKIFEDAKSTRSITKILNCDHRTLQILTEIYVKLNLKDVLHQKELQRLEKTRKFNVKKEVLQKELETESYEALGRKYGVSGNSVKKRAKRYGLI